jgi:hypothetical protein
MGQITLVAIESRDNILLDKCRFIKLLILSLSYYGHYSYISTNIHVIIELL